MATAPDVSINKAGVASVQPPKKDTGLIGAAIDVARGVGGVLEKAGTAVGQAALNEAQVGVDKAKTLLGGAGTIAGGAKNVLVGPSETPAAPTGPAVTSTGKYVPDPLNPAVAMNAVFPNGKATAPATATAAPAKPEAPKVPTADEINKRQQELHAITSDQAKKDATVLDKPAELRAAASATTDKPTLTPEKAKDNAIKENQASGIIPPEVDKKEADPYQEQIDKAAAAAEKYQAAFDEANNNLKSLLSAFNINDEQKQLAEIYLKIAQTPQEISSYLTGLGIPHTGPFVQALIDQKDAGLIAQRQYLTDMIAARQKVYDNALKINETVANNAARAFDQAFNIEGRMIDLNEKSKDRQETLDQKRQTMAQNRVKAALDSGSLAYASDATLADMAKNSGYTFADLKAMQQADKLKQENVTFDNETARMNAETSRKNAETAKAKATEATYKLGGAFTDVNDSLKAHTGSDGYTDTEFYSAWRSKAKDVNAFDATFGYLLNPNDPTAQQYLSNVKRMDKQGASSATQEQGLRVNALDENTKKNLIDDLGTAASVDELWQAYPEVNTDDIVKLWKAYNE